MRDKICSKKSGGFSLIEVLVSTSILALILLTASTMFMTFLVSSSRTGGKQIIKNEGAYALSRVEHTIRNAQSWDSGCLSNLSEITIGIAGTNGTPVLHTIRRENNRIWIRPEPAGAAVSLTSEAVTATSLNFDCRSSGNSRLVRVSFTLTKAAPDIGSGPTITENFQTDIHIRN